MWVTNTRSVTELHSVVFHTVPPDHISPTLVGEGVLSDNNVVGPQEAQVMGGGEEEQPSSITQPFETPQEDDNSIQEELNTINNLPLNHNGGEHIEDILLFPDYVEEDRREQDWPWSDKPLLAQAPAAPAETHQSK